MLIEVARCRMRLEFAKSRLPLFDSIHEKLKRTPDVFEKYREYKLAIADCVAVGISAEAIAHAKTEEFMPPGNSTVNRAARNAKRG